MQLSSCQQTIDLMVGKPLDSVASHPLSLPCLKLMTSQRSFAGLENAGNTCYMNSSIQCLYRVPEVREALKLYDASPGNMGTSMNGAHRLTVRLLCLLVHLRP